MRELLAGVAGAGVFGAFHAQKYADLAGVRLARIFDADEASARALAARHGVEPLTAAAEFFAGLDLVTIATPGRTHADLASAAIAARAHVYVEKPLATRLNDAQALVVTAAAGGRVLAVGHQERVIFGAIGLLNTAEPVLTLSSIRRGVANARNRDISCVQDLMIHDLDLAALLANRPVTSVTARGGFDEIDAELVFEGGLRASFTASRIAQRRERSLRVGYASGEVEVDFLAPSFTNGSTLALDRGFAGDPAARDPLSRSVEAFVAAARGVGAPVADGVAGVRALRLALAVEVAAGI